MITRLLIVLFQLFLLLYSCQSSRYDNSADGDIDRTSLVYHHIPVVNQIDSLSPFSVGNGEFAFTVDITGLQTFAQTYQNCIPLVTQSQWGWHSIPNSQNYTLTNTFKFYNTYGRSVPYASRQHSKDGNWIVTFEGLNPLP